MLPDYAGHRQDAIVCDVAPLPDNVPHADRMDDKLIQALSGIGIVTGTADGMPTLSMQPSGTRRRHLRSGGGRRALRSTNAWRLPTSDRAFMAPASTGW